MFERIIGWSIHNRILVVLAALIVAAVGVEALYRAPLDAIPDLSDVQVIVYTEYPGQAPRIVEDQVTYPLTTQLLAVPKASTVRGYSFFGFSFVYVIFEDGTDLYWARSRVLETLSYVRSRLPPDVTPSLGPDATGVGWAFMYVLKSDRHDLGELRSIQDWFLKYELASVSGVAEVASIGGFVRQYQITVDPNRLRAFGIPISKIRTAIQRSNSDVGGRVLEVAEKEFMIRGLGYIESAQDIEKIALGVDAAGTPILLRDIATVGIGPEMRRGVAEWDGEGETVGGIVVVRHGAGTRQVIEDVKARLAEVEGGLPEGVEVEVAYDRTALIERAVDSLRVSLTQQLLIVGLVCVLFLFHVRSALVAVITLPLGVLAAFVAMSVQGLSVNIMSLGGIAVAIGTMVDAGIVMVENAHNHLARNRGRRPHWEVVTEATREVGPTLFFALLVITVSFLPVFALEAQEGRLFKPLAFTKTYAMAAAALLAVTVVPVLVGYWVRGRIRPLDQHPVSRLLVWLYRPILDGVLRFRALVLAAAVLGLAVTAVPFARLGSEFMPRLWEGDLLYMPTTLPGISITKATEILQQTDRILRTFPEVEHVFGKLGRADTATDPAPLSMIETTILLKPESAWRPGMTPERLTEEMDAAIQVPGLTNAWTMPIRTRIDMLSTGIRTPVGIKVAGPDLAELERLGKEIEAVVRNLPGTVAAYAERVMGGNYLDFRIDRDAIARYGLTVRDVQEVIQIAIGGTNVTTTVEGLARYPVNLRYSRELRDDLPALRAVLVPTPAGPQIPLGRLASAEYVVGPPSIKSEGAKPKRLGVRRPARRGYRHLRRGRAARGRRRPGRPSARLHRGLERPVRVHATRRAAPRAGDPPDAAADRRHRLRQPEVRLRDPPGPGRRTVRAHRGDLAALRARLQPEHRRLDRDRRPGGPLRRDRHGAAAVSRPRGARTARTRPADGTGPRSPAAIRDGTVRRVRPILMTIATDVIGLLPIMWSTGAGADVMKRIATPLVGGVLTSGLVVLVLYPVVYYLWKARDFPGDSPGELPSESSPTPRNRIMSTPEGTRAQQTRDGEKGDLSALEKRGHFCFALTHFLKKGVAFANRSHLESRPSCTFVSVKPSATPRSRPPSPRGMATSTRSPSNSAWAPAAAAVASMHSRSSTNTAPSPATTTSSTPPDRSAAPAGGRMTPPRIATSGRAGQTFSSPRTTTSND